MGSLNRFNLKQILSNCAIDTLVETGTGLGNSLAYAVQAGVPEIFSVEQEESLFFHCRQRFANDAHVHLEHDYSIPFLKKKAGMQLNHALYFLDAHFVGGADFDLTTYDDSSSREGSYPLLDELDVIFKTDIQNCIIVIDDARMYFDGAFQAGTCPDFARRWQDNEALTEKLRSVERTHAIHLLRQDQGYLCIVPKASSFDQQSWVATLPGDIEHPLTFHPAVPAEVAELSIQLTALPEIEVLQIHDETYGQRFFRNWLGEIDGIRFEITKIGERDWLCVDLLLSATDASFVASGISISHEGMRLPSVMKACSDAALQHIRATIASEIAKLPMQYESRQLSPHPRIDAVTATSGRALPGISDYITATNHIRRYIFLNEIGIEGDILECASGTGYGASILAKNKNVRRYTGADIDPAAIEIARGMVADPRFNFLATSLADIDGRFDYVVSLETIEHVRNPFDFIRDIQARLRQDGVVIASIPAERWAGSHLNPEHRTNWTYQRFKRFFEFFFEAVDIHLQQLSLLGPTPLESAHIFKRLPDEERDEDFLVIAKRPKGLLPRVIIVKRTGALGDVIWITPVIAELRSRNPEAFIVVMTRHTEVFVRNPDVDLVATIDYVPNEYDELIDLDWAYEKRRNYHLLHAYSEEAGIIPSQADPNFLPHPADLRAISTEFQRRFSAMDVDVLIAIHAGASSPDRIWPAKSWHDLIVALISKAGIGVVLIGSFEDYDSKALEIEHTAVMDMVGRPSLSLSASALAQCDLFIGVDSGMSHLASAVNTPSIVLFGLANPETRLPFVTPSIGVWTSAECRGCLEELAAQAPPVCKFGRGQSFCMELISTDSVLLAATRMLDARNSGSKWRRLASLRQVTTGPVAGPFRNLSSSSEGMVNATHQTSEDADKSFGLRWLLRSLFR